MSPTPHADWPDTGVPEKRADAITTSLASTNPQHNIAIYTAQGINDEVIFTAIEAIYAPDRSPETRSMPVILAFGQEPELSWKNEAPQVADDIACPHKDNDEVILQRPANP
ncbi:MAG: hypothetical protein OXC07_03420 [Kistimonas sp.]|nr:hypothetical protein [Kistimonas sp.]